MSDSLSSEWWRWEYKLTTATVCLQIHNKRVKITWNESSRDQNEPETWFFFDSALQSTKGNMNRNLLVSAGFSSCWRRHCLVCAGNIHRPKLHSAAVWLDLRVCLPLLGPKKQWAHDISLEIIILFTDDTVDLVHGSFASQQKNSPVWIPVGPKTEL